jgi:hypothetical protein
MPPAAAEDGTGAAQRRGDNCATPRVTVARWFASAVVMASRQLWSGVGGNLRTSLDD